MSKILKNLSQTENLRYFIPTREFPPQDGGIGNFAFEVVKHLARKGHKPTVLAWQFENSAESDKLDSSLAEASIIRIAKPSRRWFQIAKLVCETWKLLRQKKIDRVLVASWNFQAIGPALLCRFFRIPYVLFVHGYDVSLPALSQVDQSLLRFCLKKADKILTNSQFTADLVKQVEPLDNIEVALLGVDAKRFRENLKPEAVRNRFKLQDKKVLLTVARLFARKGHDKVIEAMPQILEKVPNAFYLIAGRGVELENLKKKVKDLRLEEHVAFSGFVPDEDLPSYYAASDVFILPNREITDPKDPWYGDFEGFGIVFIEAAATGKPCIAGRSGGAADAVIDGETGMIVDPDSVDEVAAAAIRLLGDESMAKKMGKAGLDRVNQKMDWAVLISNIERSFENS